MADNDTNSTRKNGKRKKSTHDEAANKSPDGEPAKKNHTYTDEEDKAIFELMNTLGKKWTNISSRLFGHMNTHERPSGESIRQRVEYLISSLLKQVSKDPRSDKIPFPVALLEKYFEKSYAKYNEYMEKKDEEYDEEDNASEGFSGEIVMYYSRNELLHVRTSGIYHVVNL